MYRHVKGQYRARTTSRVVTPRSLRGSYTPCFLSTSDARGTREFTGLEMMRRIAFGQIFAHASTRLATIEALVLKRSSRVMPGLRGTPAGIKTMLRGEGGIGQGVSRFMVIPLL